MANLTHPEPGRGQRMLGAARASLTRTLTRSLGRLPPNAQTRVLRVVQVAASIREKSLSDDVPTQAAALTFAAFLSLPPLALLGLSVSGFAVSADTTPAWFGSLRDAIPGLEELTATYFATLSTAKVSLGVVALVGVVWSASVVASRAQRALGVVFGLPRRGFVERRIRAIGVMLLLGAVLVASVVATGLVSGVTFPGILAVPSALLIRALPVTVGFGFFLASYRLLTPSGGPELRAHVPGAIVAAAGWQILLLVGGVVVSGAIARATALYGAIGAIFGAMVFLRLAAWLWLFGAELSSVLARDRA